jgi:deoxyribodipyrimidine photo-lyase
MKAFFKGPVKTYAEARDRMDRAGTSRLSQDLKFGLLSIREVWAAAGMSLTEGNVERTKFENELLWREFTHHTLWDRPHLLKEPFRADFKGFPWRSEPTLLTAWKEGKTGYPIVDAASRQLLREGYVHNRARMIAASFLTKHLLTDYKLGEAHYLAYLTDGDWAQNNAGWQWSAGCGCDAQPYFRVFNPVTQGEKFDPAGAYVRRWVPELARMHAKYIHSPWEASADELLRAGVVLGKDYPRPIVEHAMARTRFLETAAKHLKKA